MPCIDCEVEFDGPCHGGQHYCGVMDYNEDTGEETECGKPANLKICFEISGLEDEGAFWQWVCADHFDAVEKARS
jgi:hypothetical protein